VALSFGDGTGTLYVDGQEVGSTQTGLDWETSPEHIQIGALGWGSVSGKASYTTEFNGEISDVVIYDSILDAGDMTALTDGTPITTGTPVADPAPEPQPEPTPAPVPDPGPVADPAPAPAPQTGRRRSTASARPTL
jgi:hypothetical protein